MAVFPVMLSLRDGFEVGDFVVRRVFVLVMDVDPIGNRPMRLRVDRPVEQLPEAVAIISLVEPPFPAPPYDHIFDFMSHVNSVSPCRRDANETNPFPWTKTG
jgi:hypothetical protein